MFGVYRYGENFNFVLLAGTVIGSMMASVETGHLVPLLRCLLLALAAGRFGPG